MAYGDPEYDVVEPATSAEALGGMSDAPEHSDFLSDLGKGIASIGEAIVTGIKSMFGGMSGQPVAGEVAAKRAPVITEKSNIKPVMNNAGFRTAVKVGTGGIGVSVTLANGATVPVGFRLDSAINAMSKMPRASVAFNTLQATTRAAFTSQGMSTSTVDGHIDNGIAALKAGNSIASADVPNLSITPQGGILQSAPPIKQPISKPESEGSDDSVENAILATAIATTIAGVIASRGNVSISARMSTIGNTMYKTQIGGVSGNWEADPQAGVITDATIKQSDSIEGGDMVRDTVEVAPQTYSV